MSFIARKSWWIAAAAASAAVAAAYLVPGAGGRAPDIARGAALYAENCASCHGADLKGAPDWREPGPEGRLPAPPHDASGHTWHHGDALLLRIVRDGSAVVVGGGYESNMPGFGETMTEAEIGDVLAFIRGRWPEREAAMQAEASRREAAR